MNNIKRFASLALAPLLLASGLLFAAPAQAGSIGGGGSHTGNPGSPGSGSCDGCSSGGGGANQNAHTSKYTGIAAFGERSRTNPNRGAPKPLGTYLNGPFKGKTIRDDTTGEYNKDGQPCRASGGDKIVGPQAEMLNLPVALKWTHVVDWNNGATKITGSDIKFKGCVNSVDLSSTTHTCPVLISDLKWTYKRGGGLSGAERSGTPTLSGSQNTAFGDSFLSGFGGKTEQQILSLAHNCDSLRTDYDFDPRSGGQGPVTDDDLLGNYQVEAALTYVKCRTGLSSEWTQTYTDPNGGNGWNSKLAKRKFLASEKWLGCETPYKVKQENWITYGCVDGKFDVFKSANGGNGSLDQRWKEYDFAATRAACGGTPPPPIDCVVSPDAQPEVRVDGSPGVLRSGATVAANGKQATINWPQPRISGDAASANVRDKKLVFSSNIDDVWNVRSGNGSYDGLGQADPVKTNASLAGGELRGWNSPLTVQFFRSIGAPVDSDQPPAFSVSATPTYTYDARTESHTFDPATGRVISSVVTTPTTGECPASSVELFVSGSRNTN